MSIQQQKFIEIADAIRAKTGETDLIKPSDFANKIDNVYNAGEEAQEKKFWNAYFDNMDNNSRRYNYAFAGRGWVKSTFKPNRDIKPIYANSMFQYNYMGGDLAATLEELGVTLDLSEATGVSSIFHEVAFTRLPKIDLTSANTAAYVFYNCFNLVTIDEVVFSENNTFNSNTFKTLNKLANLTITGVIANSGLNFSSVNSLSHDSLFGKLATQEQIDTGKNILLFNGNYYYGGIIIALKDYSQDTSGTAHTITFGTTNLAKLTDAEKAIATQKGWTLT